MTKEKCPLCPKEYQSKNDLNKHLQKYHNTTLEQVKWLNVNPSLKDLWDNKDDDRWNDGN